jgi:hypothetical protein
MAPPFLSFVTGMEVVGRLRAPASLFRRKMVGMVESKIFRTDAAIYTAVVVAQRICPSRPNCEFRVLLRRFAATA